VWLQPLMCCDCKKYSCKTRMWVIATLSQCDCTLIAVWLRLEKTGKKCDWNKPVQKKLQSWHCQIATRLVFAWCGCNLVKIRLIAK
jgi:hypothetical protein